VVFRGLDCASSAFWSSFSFWPLFSISNESLSFPYKKLAKIQPGRDKVDGPLESLRQVHVVEHNNFFFLDKGSHSSFSRDHEGCGGSHCAQRIAVLDQLENAQVM